jgi:hypothetical protein
VSRDRTTCIELAETNAGYVAAMLEQAGAIDVEVTVLETFDSGARFLIVWR